MTTPIITANVCNYWYPDGAESVVRFCEFSTHGRPGLGAMSVFFYRFRTKQFYLSKVNDCARSDSEMWAMPGQVLADLVKRCIGFDIVPDTSMFENPADETVFLLSYEKYPRL